MNSILSYTNNLIYEIECIEEGTFRRIGLYGVFGALRNWFVRETNPEVVRDFQLLINAVKKAIEEFNNMGYDFSDYVNMREIDEFINKAIHKCRSSAAYEPTGSSTGFDKNGNIISSTSYKYDSSKEGSTCRLKAFLSGVAEIIGSLITVYIGVLQESNEKVRVATFRELLKINPKNKDLQKLKNTLEILYGAYVNTMSSKNINKVWAFFGGLKTGKVTSDMKRELIDILDKSVSKSVKSRSYSMI